MRFAPALGMLLAASQAPASLTQAWIDRFDAKKTRVPESVRQVVTFPSGDLAIVVERQLEGRMAVSVERFSPLGVRRWFRDSANNLPWNVREIRPVGEELLVGFENIEGAWVEHLNSNGAALQALQISYGGRAPFAFGAMGITSNRTLVGMGMQSNRLTGANEVVVVRRSSRSFTAYVKSFADARESVRMVVTPTFAAYVGSESSRIEHIGRTWKGLPRMAQPELAMVLPDGGAVVGGFTLTDFRAMRIPLSEHQAAQVVNRSVDARSSLDAVSHNANTNRTFFAGTLQAKPNFFIVDWTASEIDNDFQAGFPGQSTVTTLLGNTDRLQPELLVLGNVNRGTGWQPFVLPPDGRSFPRFLPRGPLLRAAANRVGASDQAWLAGNVGLVGWLNSVRLVDGTAVVRASTSREIGTDEQPDSTFLMEAPVPSLVVVGTTTGPSGARPYLTRTTGFGERAVTLDFAGFPSFAQVRSSTKVSEDLVAMLIADRAGEDVLVHVDTRSGRVGPGLAVPGGVRGLTGSSFRWISSDAERNIVLGGFRGDGAVFLASLDRSQRLRWTQQIEDSRWPTIEVLGFGRGTSGNVLVVARGIERGGTSRLLFISVNRLDGRQIAFTTAPWPAGYEPGRAILRAAFDNRFVLALERRPTQPGLAPDVQLVSGPIGTGNVSSIVVPRGTASEALAVAMDVSQRGDELVLVVREIVSERLTLRVLRYSVSLRSIWSTGAFSLGTNHDVVAALVADRDRTRIMYRQDRPTPSSYVEIDRAGKLGVFQRIASSPFPAYPRLQLINAFGGIVLVSNAAATGLDAASTVQLLR